MYLKRIKELREEKHLLQKDICNLLLLKQQNYSRYETGNMDFPAEYIIKLAKFYNVSTDYIFELTDEREPYKRKN